MNERAPSISIVIPTYNAPDLLEQTLASVFAQTFSDYEVIVINDGSTDNTAERLQKYRSDVRFRLINQVNGGIGNARNRGMDEARGKYIALLDHDDLWMPEKLQTQFEYMQAHPECVGCGTPWAFSTSPHTPEYNLSEITDANGHVLRPQLRQGFMISSDILLDRERIKGLRYAEYRRCIEDTPFQTKLLARGPFGIAGDKILMIYRRHPDNYSSLADFFFNGIRMLRRMDREGEFDCLTPADHRDFHQFLSHLGRTAAARQIEGRRIWRALWVYFRELPYQLRWFRWRFLMGFPFLAFLSLVRPKKIRS